MMQLDVTVSRKGHRLAYVQAVRNVNIWRLDLSGSPVQAQKLISSSREQIAPSFSPDGSKIAFSANRSGAVEVWVCDADGSNAVQLTSYGVRATGMPRWSPDGKLLAFDSRAGGESNIYVIDPNVGVARKLSIDIMATTCLVGLAMAAGYTSSMERMLAFRQSGKYSARAVAP